jgi:hypothetical protein
MPSIMVSLSQCHALDHSFTIPVLCPSSIIVSLSLCNALDHGLTVPVQCQVVWLYNTTTTGVGHIEHVVESVWLVQEAGLLQGA